MKNATIKFNTDKSRLITYTIYIYIYISIELLYYLTPNTPFFNITLDFQIFK